jgi:predicted amidohydrolase
MVMSSSVPERLRFAAAAVIGLAVSAATPAGIVASVGIPALVFCQRHRGAAFLTGAAFYGAALWPVIPGARNFFGPDASIVSAVAMWVIAILLLASTWAVVWSGRAREALWRGPVAIILTVVPPLGIIGWASPILASGLLFPGLGWVGFASCIMLTGALAVWPRKTLATAGMIALGANLLYREPARPPDWEGVNSNFGGIAHGQFSPMAEYRAAQWIQRRAVSSAAKVIVFPETVVPAWTAATDAFWQPTLDALRARGKTIVVGARMLIPSQYVDAPSGTEFSAALASLNSLPGRNPLLVASTPTSTASEFSYDNSVMIRGANVGAFQQHIPVPIAMWNPMRAGSARIHLRGPSVITIDGERAAILICYEQTLTWPALSSMMARPTILIGMANDYWAEGTTIAKYQTAAMRSWARLMGIPYIVSINT